MAHIAVFWNVHRRVWKEGFSFGARRLADHCPATESSAPDFFISTENGQEAESLAGGLFPEAQHAEVNNKA